MEMLKLLRKPALILNQIELKRLLEAKYATVNEEKIRELVQLNTKREELEGMTRDLSGKKASFKTEILELKEKACLRKDTKNQIKENISNIKKQKVVVKETIELNLMKKKQAELGNNMAQYPCEGIDVRWCMWVNVLADRDNAHTELIKTNEAYVKGSMHYKRKLHIRIELGEEENVTVQFLKICTPDGSMCSIRLNHADRKWRSLGFTPDLACSNELGEQLQETQDIQGFLAYVRHLFKVKVQSVK